MSYNLNIAVYQIHLKSITPFVMHNTTTADPLHPITKKLKEISSIKTKADEHHLAMAKLQWEGGLYFDDEMGLYLSSKMISGCIRASARKEKKGKNIKAVIVDCIPGTPLIPYEGKSIEELWNTTNKNDSQVYVFSEVVTVQKSKIMRTRPIFHKWEAKFNILLDTLIMSEKELERILITAGLEYGIGELRPQLGTGIYGKFSLEGFKKI